MIFACVYKKGGIYTKKYVKKLHCGLSKYCKEKIDFICLSDDEESIGYVPLKHEWSGWWAKLELFRPDLEEDIFYLDLDTVICGDLDEIIKTCRMNENPIMLEDFFKNPHFGSGIMWLPKKHRNQVWEKWIAGPESVINRCKRAAEGDQKFITECYKEIASKWQHLLLDQIVSYKIHCKNKKPKNSRIVCYHGSPKPHETNWASDGYLSWKFKSKRNKFST